VLEFILFLKFRILSGDRHPLRLGVFEEIPVIGS